MHQSPEGEILPASPLGLSLATSSPLRASGQCSPSHVRFELNTERNGIQPRQSPSGRIVLFSDSPTAPISGHRVHHFSPADPPSPVRSHAYQRMTSGTFLAAVRPAALSEVDVPQQPASPPEHTGFCPPSKPSRPVPPPIQSPGGGVKDRFRQAIMDASGDARGVRRVLFKNVPGEEASMPVPGLTTSRCLTWQIRVASKSFLIQVNVSLSGRRQVHVNGELVHEEFKPLQRFNFGPLQLPGAYPHTMTIEQPSLTQPFQVRLLIDNLNFEKLRPGITPPGMMQHASGKGNLLSLQTLRSV